MVMIEYLIKLFHENQFLTGGFVLGIIGGMIAYMKNLPRQLFYFIRRKIIFSTEIENHYNSFHLFSYWLQKQIPVIKNKNFFLREEDKLSRWVTVASDDDDSDNPLLKDNNSIQKIKTFFIPSEGIHWFRHKGKNMFISFSRKEVNNTSSSPEFESAYRYDYTIYMFGRNEKCQKVIDDIINEVNEELGNKITNKIKIKTSGFLNRYGENWFGWKLSALKTPRTKDTLIFDDGFYENIYSDIEKFIHNKEWYREKGIPWRRGYLLYGVPGTGKTTLIETLAGEFKMGINILDLMNDKLTDQYLIDLFSQNKENSVIVVEDIDTIFDGRIPTSDKVKITFSGLLNAMDGLASREGQIVFMTTNNIDILDNALKSSGRLDSHIKFDYATEQQKHKMFLKFFKDDTENAKKFEEATKDFHISMAKLQEHFVLYGYSAEAVFENIGELK